MIDDKSHDRDTDLMIAETIRRFFDEPLLLDQNVLSFIDSIFSDSAEKVLEYLISNGPDSESEPLYDLLFFPDESFQIRLEPVLGTIGSTSPDEIMVTKYLTNRPPIAVFELPDSSVFRIPMPPSIIPGFVKRLRMTRCIDSRIKESIRRFDNPSVSTMVQVKLRNASFEQSDETVTFLAGFFRVSDIGDHTFLLNIDFLIRFLENRNQATDIYTGFMELKHDHVSMIERIRQVSEMMESLSMESLMARGIHIPPVRMDALIAEIDRIDRICMQIFGKTDFIQRPDIGTMTLEYDI